MNIPDNERQSEDGKPSIEQILGFNPQKYIGGMIVGSTSSFGYIPENSLDVKSRVTNICLGGDAPNWMLELHFLDEEGVPDMVSGEISGVKVAETTQNELMVKIPFIGEYKILLPRKEDDQVSEKRVNRELQNIRERELFHLN